MVMPFENQTTAPGLEWISEAFPEVLSQRMESPRLYVISRDDRSYAFDHAGIPLTVRPSRATVYRVAEQMDADYVVLGSYSFDGQTFKANAQLLDMKKLHLYPEVHSSGALTNLIDLQTTLAWELLQQMTPPPAITRDQFLKASTPIRLDAFENYIRGILATDQQQKIRYLRNAVKLNPNYTLAMLQLGKTYYSNHEYESAAAWFSSHTEGRSSRRRGQLPAGHVGVLSWQFREGVCRIQLSGYALALDRGLQQPGGGGGPARPARVRRWNIFPRPSVLTPTMQTTVSIWRWHCSRTGIAPAPHANCGNSYSGARATAKPRPYWT